jgi:S1-C subfamily serine protease
MLSTFQLGTSVLKPQSSIIESEKMTESEVSAMMTTHHKFRENLERFPGVHATSLGRKSVNNVDTDIPAIVFHVTEKQANLPKDQRIPETIDGIATDVVVSPQFIWGGVAAAMAPAAGEELPNGKKYRPMKGGSQLCITGFSESQTGTLGCGVTQRRDPKDIYAEKPRRYLLTNQHVAGDPGTKVAQPLDSYGANNDTVGYCVRSVKNDVVDAAIVGIDWYDDGVLPEILEIGQIKGTYTVTFADCKKVLDKILGYPVRKYGRTTGLTHGRVTNIDYGGFGSSFRGQLLITAPVKVPFGDHGDSGSVIVDDKNNVVGLFWSVNAGHGIATPIQTVLDALDVDMLLEY